MQAPDLPKNEAECAHVRGCLIDSSPLRLEEEEIDHLRVLAHMVSMAFDHFRLRNAAAIRLANTII